jgi:hypothetical protein
VAEFGFDERLFKQLASPLRVQHRHDDAGD